MLHPAVRLTILKGVIGHHLGHIGEGIGWLPIFSLFDDFLAFLPLIRVGYNMLLVTHMLLCFSTISPAFKQPVVVVTAPKCTPHAHRGTLILLMKTPLSLYLSLSVSLSLSLSPSPLSLYLSLSISFSVYLSLPPSTLHSVYLFSRSPPLSLFPSLPLSLSLSLLSLFPSLSPSHVMFYLTLQRILSASFYRE